PVGLRFGARRQHVRQRHEIEAGPGGLVRALQALDAPIAPGEKVLPALARPGAVGNGAEGAPVVAPRLGVGPVARQRKRTDLVRIDAVVLLQLVRGVLPKQKTLPARPFHGAGAGDEAERAFTGLAPLFRVLLPGRRHERERLELLRGRRLAAEEREVAL